MKYNKNIRNIAIIAHVDHGKTTLVDNMFQQSGLIRDNQIRVDRIMDNMDLERERGITIAAKNCSVFWNQVKINIIDTPGHADFGGEVERSLSMADGAILLVDASEGPLPQTRFVLEKALAKKLKILIVINKIDRKDARVGEVLDEIYDLLIDLGADDEILEFEPMYAVGKDGIASLDPNVSGKNLQPLFDKIIREIPPPSYDENEPFQMLVSDLGYSDYLGRLAIGKVVNGSVTSNAPLMCIKEKEQIPLKVSSLQIYNGLTIKSVNKVEAGDIVVLAGIENVNIGDTICTEKNPKPLPRITVDEPTVFMKFTVNRGPYNGKEGKYVQSGRLKERLYKETLQNVAIKVEESEDKDSFIVKGRGEFQMAILIETIRREGFEFCVGRPQVNIKTIEGKKSEPIEKLYVDCDEQFMGVVTEKLSKRKGILVNIEQKGGNRVKMEFSVPSRALIGYRDTFLTDTKGTGIMNSYFEGYGEYRGEFPSRHTGSIVADRLGKAVPYAIFNLEPRGKLFVNPGDLVYEGMIVGEHNRDNDINVNICKEKKLTNMRAANKDENISVTTIKPMTIEQAITFIKEDEMVEITPISIRLRKVELSAQKRHAMEGMKKSVK